MKRTPIARPAPLLGSVVVPLRRTRIRRAPSPVLAASRREFARITPRIHERDMFACAWCGAPSQTINHRVPRGMGGRTHDPDVHCPSRLVAMCHLHHDLAETARREEFTDLGFFVPSGLTPQLWPVKYHDGWHRLTPDLQRIPVTLTHIRWGGAG